MNDIPEIEQYSSKIYAADASVTIKLKEDYEKIGKRSLDDLKGIVINLTKGLRISDVSFEAIESSENFQGGGGNALMGGGEQLLKKWESEPKARKLLSKARISKKWPIWLNY